MKEPKPGKKSHNDPYALVRSAASRWRAANQDHRAILCIMVDESQPESQVATVIGNSKDQLFGGLMAVLEQNHEVGAELIYAVAAYDLAHGGGTINRIMAKIAEANQPDQEPATPESNEDNQN